MREPKRSQIERTSPQAASSGSGALKRTMQASRIRDLRQALIEAGHKSLDQQATALGLCRSTTWTVLRGDHKCSGLGAALVARMWVAPELPPTARTILANYITEKSQGAYGHKEDQRERFIAQLRRLGLKINQRCQALAPGYKLLAEQEEWLGGEKPCSAPAPGQAIEVSIITGAA
jgi:hypothetical protein